MPNKKISSEIAIGLIIFLTIIVSGIFWVQDKNFESNNKQAAADKQEFIKTENINEDNIPVGWKLYKHDVLGIKFIYPEIWGEPMTEPIKSITDLADMDKTFERLNIYYRNNLSISFSDNHDVQLTLFNEQFNGKGDRDIVEPYDYYQNAATDDVLKLKTTNDICSYKIDFTYKYNDQMAPQRLSAMFADCANNSKLVLTEEKEQFQKMLYTYDLKLLSFHKIENGYFNNVLVTYNVDHIAQSDEKLNSLDEFFVKLKNIKNDSGIASITQDEVKKIRDDFEKFSNSIQPYKATVIQSVDFQKIAGEDPSITTIRKYYWLISLGKLEDAYAMYAKSNITPDTFKNWYKYVYFAKPSNFEKTGANTYEFTVQYQEENTNPTRYKVVMAVNEGKIETKSSIEMLSEDVSFGNNKAYTIKRNNKNYLILNINGQEVIVDQGNAQYDKDFKNISDVKFFGDVRFSPKGNFLLYTMTGWEWDVEYVYDIKQRKNIYNTTGASAFEFTADENNFIACTSAGMASGAGGQIFKLPKFELLFDLRENLKIEDYLSVDCKIENPDTVVFNLSGWAEEKKEKTIKYSLSQKRLIGDKEW